jgi:hypothetical protein
MTTRAPDPDATRPHGQDRATAAAHESPHDPPHESPHHPQHDTPHDPPPAADLLATARAALLDEVLPHLPAHAHYTARMIAHAMGICARELSAPPLDAALRATLAALAGCPPGASLTAIGNGLAARIRAGACGGADRARLHDALVAWTQARLAISDARAGAAR